MNDCGQVTNFQHICSYIRLQEESSSSHETTTTLSPPFSLYPPTSEISPLASSIHREKLTSVAAAFAPQTPALFSLPSVVTTFTNFDFQRIEQSNYSGDDSEKTGNQHEHEQQTEIKNAKHINKSLESKQRKLSEKFNPKKAKAAANGFHGQQDEDFNKRLTTGIEHLTTPLSLKKNVEKESTPETLKLTETDVLAKAKESAKKFYTNNSNTVTPKTIQILYETNEAKTEENPMTVNDRYSIKLTEIITDAYKIPSTETLGGSLKSFASETSAERKAIEAFEPLIQDTNEKLLKERTVYTQKHELQVKQPKKDDMIPTKATTGITATDDNWQQNLLLNELVEMREETNKDQHYINWSPYLLHPATAVNDFTGKLLAEQDGVITEIEQKFRLNEFVADTANAKDISNANATATEVILKEVTSPAKNVKETFTATKPLQIPHQTFTVNREVPFTTTTITQPYQYNKGYGKGQFIEKRVKKSFDFPLHRAASDATHIQHFDFANTKFSNGDTIVINHTGNTNELNIPQHNNDGIYHEHNSVASRGVGVSEEVELAKRPQPEFSTTKFYNSKELYNEMLQHKIQLNLNANNNKEIYKTTEKPNLEQFIKSSLSLNSFAVLHSPKLGKIDSPLQKQSQSDDLNNPWSFKKVSLNTLQPTARKEIVPSSYPVLLTTVKPQKTLQKSKLIIKSLTAFKAGVNNTNYQAPLESHETPAPAPNVHTIQKSINAATSAPTTEASKFVSKLKTLNLKSLKSLNDGDTTAFSITAKPSAVITTSNGTVSINSKPHIETKTAVTNPTKSTSKPIARPRILSPLQEKINSLECNIQILPQNSHLWRGNETHELLLPIMFALYSMSLHSPAAQP
uniref:Uncharacterized protein n=1 Tax=Glossina brevipalpis TaxID=37001 RepID=A0A1A9WZN9_9MUSC